MRVKQTIIFLSCLLSIGITGCSTDNDTLPAARTVLVYMAGDNNLSAETDEKLEAIARSWSSEGGNLIVYQDREGQLPRLIELKKEGKFNHVHHYTEAQNSCSPQVFGNVVRQVAARYPARDYGLLFFSHATGWLPQGNYPTPQTRTIGKDGSNEMALTDFAKAIPDGQFRFILFEACLMAGVEAAYELKDKTQTIVASSAEILSPGFTDIYPQVIPLLFTPEPGLEELAQCYFDHWNAKSGFHRSATISVIHTAELQQLAELVHPLTDNGVEVAPDRVTSFDSGTSQLFCDLGEYLQLKCPDKAGLAAIAQQMERVVTYRAATPRVMGNPCRNHSGLTVYLPRAGFEKLNTYYYQTRWSQSIHTAPTTGVRK